MWEATASMVKPREVFLTVSLAKIQGQVLNGDHFNADSHQTAKDFKLMGCY